MRRNGGVHNLLLISAIGTLFTLMAIEINKLMEFRDAITPSFVGAMFGHAGTVIIAYAAGVNKRENRNGKRTRFNDHRETDVQGNQIND